MPRIKASSIDALRHRVNLHDVVEPYVALKRSGSSYKGLSPFTTEKTPSFYVHPDKGFFKCFSSGLGGDLFKFIQLKENLEFPEAVEFLARRFNIPLEYEEDGTTPETRSLRKQLFEIHEAATTYFRHAFLDPKATAIRDYWEKERGFPATLGEDFQIGYAPVKGEGLLQALQKKHFDGDALVACGLFYGQHPRQLRPRFRGRLMIPIRDVQGRVIAFTARQTAMTPQDHDVEKAKYINSPETPIFIKKQMLFNLDRARTAVNDSGTFLLVEGQLDALRCYSAGLRHTVAPQGSGISEEQIILLKRYANSLDCLLDGDRAGRQAALRVLPLALKVGLNINFLPLEPGQDPDDLLRTGGLDAFRDLEQHRESPMAFAIQTLLPQGPESPPATKQEALKGLFAIVQQCPSSVLQDDFIAEISQRLRVERGSLERDFRQTETAAPLSSPSTSEREMRPEWLTSAYDELLLLLLHYKELAQEIAEIIDSQWIDKETVAGRLLDRFLGAYQEDLWPGVDYLHELLEDDQEHALAYSLLVREPNYEDPFVVANAAIASLHKKHVEARMRALRLEIASAPAEKAPTLQRQIIHLRQALNDTPQLTQT